MPYCPGCEKAYPSTVYWCGACRRPLEMDILISDKAFLTMTVASVEVFKKESFGSLWGYKTRNRIWIEYAIPSQSARLKPSGVEPNWDRTLRVKNTVEHLIQLQHLGYFHSHAQRGRRKGKMGLSDEDIESMNSCEVEIIIVVNEAKRKETWGRSKQRLRGHIGDHRIEIGGFYKDQKGRISERAVLCPYALGFDRTLLPI